MNKDLDTALMLIMGWIAFAMLVAAVNLVIVVGKLIFGAWHFIKLWYSIYTMKFKMFVCVDGHKSLIASTNNFSDFQTLIDELEKFGTQWEATEDGVTVFTTILN